MLDRALTRQPVHPILWAIAGTMIALEVVFHAVSAGYLSPFLSRWHGYALFAFFDPMFEAATHGAGVSLHLLWSFLTHAFLHGGWLHLALNVAAFLGLGHMISRAAGIGPFLVIFAVTAACGALAFALLSDFRGPMVGASGVVFGFLGTVTSWQEIALRRAGLPRTEVWQRVFGLMLLNGILDLAMGGMLAWEAHLGGFIGGWAIAWAYPPRAAGAARA